MVCEHSDVFASSCAIARAFPLFTRRSSSSRRAEKKNVTVEFLIVEQESSILNDAELKVQHLFLPLKFVLRVFKSILRIREMRRG